tara:strand:+ start:201 stop:1256 length:1056 start_codon:yes stop_codon:yes gene_type:complete
MRVIDILEVDKSSSRPGFASGVGKLVGGIDAPGTGKFNFGPLPDGSFEVVDKDNNRVGTVKGRNAAMSATIKFNKVARKFGIGSPQFQKALKQAGSKLTIAMDYEKKVSKPGKVGKAVAYAKDNIPGARKVAGWGSKALALIKGTIIGKVVFGVLAVEDLAAELDRWGNIYVAEGCTLQSKKLDAQEMRIRKIIVENLAFVATGIGMAASGLIRLLGTYLALLPVAGWIATALAWVSAGVLGSMIAKLLSNSSVGEYVAEHLLGSIITEKSIKMLALANCPKESLSESWEAQIDEDIKLVFEKRNASTKQAEQKAANEIKKMFLKDKQLNKIIQVTKQKVDKGEIEYKPSK